MSEKLSSKPPSGFRDFLGPEMRLRETLRSKISKVYEQHGFDGIETPALENLKVLQGSGGQENEKLIFKTLKRGEKFQTALESKSSEENDYADLGLRFDLTVPLSRVVGEYQNDIQFPWKVFHIGPVWRAERAQKGRYREFYQCDVDIVGSDDMMAEFEVIQAVSAAFRACGINGFRLHLNHRSIIESIAQKFGFESKLEDFAVILDKKDKLPIEKIESELKSLGAGEVSSDLISILSSEKSEISDLKKFDEATGQSLESLAKDLESVVECRFDLSLVRGMGYYTGTLFEFRLPGTDYSIGGGGRYDKLLSRFSKKEFSAVGCSLGFERLLLALQESEPKQSEDRLFVPNFGTENLEELRQMSQKLRSAGISVDLYPAEAKLKAQLKYANQKGYQWVLIAGASEFQASQFVLKNLDKSSEEKLDLDSIVSKLKSAPR